VELTCAWISKHFRAVRGYEQLPTSHEAMILWAMIALLTRRLAQSRELSDAHYVRQGFPAGGLDALAPLTRPLGSRIDTTVWELAVVHKRGEPRAHRRTGGAGPARLVWLGAVESALPRLFHRRDLMSPTADGPPVCLGWFEAAPNQRWIGDALTAHASAAARPTCRAFLVDLLRLADTVSETPLSGGSQVRQRSGLRGNLMSQSLIDALASM
jgi:hypothetical protein